MIGDRIRDLRNQKRLSQTDLAKIINVSQQTVTKWETGKSEPSSSAINRLADYLDVSSDYLLLRKKTKQKMTIDEAIDTIMSADGKEPTEHDRKLMESIIKAYLDNRE